MKELLSLCPEKLHCPVPLETLFRIPIFAEKMGTLDDDMAQEGDIAKLQENFNEVVEKNIQIDHQRQEIEELKELYTKLKQKRRLDSLRPRTTPKKYKF